MNETCRGVLALAGRVLLSAIFFLAAVMNDIPNFSKTVGEMNKHSVPIPEILLPIAIVFLLVGSVSVVVGYKARWGALLLFLFLVPATYYFHNPSGISDPEKVQNQMNHLMKNVALMGAMLLLLANGPGPMSLDCKAKH